MKQVKFTNVKNVPSPDGVREKRLLLSVNKDGVPVDRYWRARFNEGALEQEKTVRKKKTEVEVENTLKELKDK